MWHLDWCITEDAEKAEIKERVTELLGDDRACREWKNGIRTSLSGGQRQRVAFARALAPNPQSSLCSMSRLLRLMRKVRTELATHGLKEYGRTQLGITSIFVTHDQEEAVEVADEIIITNHGND